MTSAISHAEALYFMHLPDRDFVRDLAEYLRHGYVINFPDTFVMARPVERSAPLEWIADPAHKFWKPDTWFVCMAVGNLEKLVSLLPFALPCVAFCRKFRNNLRFYPMPAFLRRCHHGS